MTNNKPLTGDTTMKNYTIKGIISAERACECCGNAQLERNVVLADESGSLIYVGSDCAGKLVHGAKKAANTKLVVKEAEFTNRCIELLATYSAAEVKEYIRRRTCNGQVYLNRLAAAGLV
jgi:hypothetical protein